MDSLEKITDTEVLDRIMSMPKFKAAGIRGQIMAMMLNGEIEWGPGCVMHAWNDKTILEKFNE